MAGKVLLQRGCPFERSDLSEECQGGRFDLIYRFSAVSRAIGIVWISKQQALLHEKFYRIITNGFAGVRCVANSVGRGYEINDRGDATERSLCFSPWSIWLKIQQREQRISGSFVPLFWAKFAIELSMDSASRRFLVIAFLLGLSDGMEMFGDELVEVALGNIEVFQFTAHCSKCVYVGIG